MNRPRVTLKLATSLDGRIATASGESRWITGEASRAEVQKLRAAHDAVLIGAETARRDNPSLLARTEPLPAKQPARVVLTSRLDLEPDLKMFSEIDQAPVILFAVERGGPARRAIFESMGVQVEYLTAREGGGVDVAAALARLNELGLQRVLVEGGGKVAAAMIAAGVVDGLEWFRAPIALGAAGRPAIADLSYGALAEAPKWRRVALRELGPDIWESYERA
jgi:diaminohydroxyphosphoribosylaminopyrimidine deaminase / 5-amino-6-(5-phosphoribosylamino)uracil reductase